MGYQLKDVCYSTEAMAQDAYAQSMQPAFVVNDTTSVFFYPEKISGSWCMGSHSLSNGSISQCPGINFPTFATCTDNSDPTASFQTGMELGSAVAGVCVIAFLWRYLRVRH
ncbi:MAG: hypothetical protein E6Q51_05035 [Methylophilus methylotrophus]|uniref:Uncharacterized protein n=1 Tax=Methylophilus methylotrophus TaxID=17 RepID=A0A5C7WH31_METME|nr:MAG: hypothetical protein E6Q51_05035 [Methylophilus methylotrophus]